MNRIPVTILTGFLGAGKTTLLNKLLTEPGFEDTAVVVNEFGEVGVDGALVEAAGDRAFAMSTGCLCCTVSGDIRLTLLRLLDEAERGIGPSFRRIVIETTGIADPLPVLQTFMTNDYLLQRFTLNGVVTVVDAVHSADLIDRFEEARRQIAVADLLLVTKTDLAYDPASKRDTAALQHQLNLMAPNATVKDAREATAEAVFSLAAFDPAGKPPDVRAWLQFSDGDNHHHAHGNGKDGGRHGETATAFCFAAVEAVAASALNEAIATLQGSFGVDLLRMKGLVELEGNPGCPRVLHVVGHITSPLRLLGGWPDGIDQTRIVMIVSGPNRVLAPETLKRFLPELDDFSPNLSSENFGQ